jgi:hypothetical protein
MYGVMRPLVRGLEAIGRADRMLAYMGARQRRRLVNRNPFRDYRPGPQDVFVMTYAKSGTNWMLQIAQQLIHHGRASYEHIHDVAPWPDIVAMAGPMGRYAIPLAEANQWQAAPEKKRVIKTHFNWDLLPYSSDARYIAVIRDPKDVFVSNYFFVRDGVYGAAMPKPETWYKLFLSRDFVIGGSWAVNAAGYWAERHRPNVLIFSFKQMKRDPRGTVVRVAAFLDIHVPDLVIDEVCRLSSFEYMKSIDRKFRIGKMIPWRPEGAMMRKGLQGGSGEILSLEQQRHMDAHFMTELRALGSDFPYEEFCDVTRVAAGSRE